MSNCTDCLSNCAGNISPDKCIKYTGPDNTNLSICNGDSLYTILQVLIQKAVDSSSNNDVINVGLTCSFVANILGTNTKTVQNLIQALIDGECELKDSLDTLSAQINRPLVINTSCLTGLPTQPTRDDILKAVVSLLCTTSANLAIVVNDYVKATELNTLIAQYLQSIGISTSTGTAKEYTKMPEFVALPYHGKLTLFSSDGTGSGKYEKVYLCLGQTVNGFKLPDYRGRSPLGDNTNVSLAGISSDVNPLNPNNIAISANNYYGEFKHQLTTGELPVHSHDIEDKTHTHSVIADIKSGTGSTQIGPGGNTNAGSVNITTSASLTGITNTESIGSSFYHNNTQPSVGCYFIMYIPS